MKLLLTAITSLYVGNISVIADISPVVKEGGKNAGVADARSIPAGNCILSDDFNTPSGLWTLDAIHPNTMNVSVANNRLNFWSPSENSGFIDAFAYALSDGWKIDMTQDWAVSCRWHITPPIPYYGDVGIALVLILEGNVDNFYIQRGYTLGGGVFYDPNDGFIDNYESTNLWYDGVRYIQTEYNRTYSENTTYIWYVASSQRIYYSEVLYSPIDAGVSLAGMSDSPDAWLGIGGYSMGYVSSFGLGSLWGDDFCIIDGHVVTCDGDTNADNSVNVTDLLTVIDQWGGVGGSGDVNSDGIVNVNDLLMVVGNWGECE